MKKVISLCLLIAMLCSVLLSSSCDGITEDEYTGFYPKGYTGGFSREPGATTEFWWVETYEECIEAIKLLKSHGSTFTDDALSAIAAKAIERNTGARGLRSIMESIMLDIMYTVPSDESIEEVIIDKDTVNDGTPPQTVNKSNSEN